MTTKIAFIFFWAVFIGLFILFFSPVASYISNGFPEYKQLNTITKKVFFTVHIFSGILVYAITFLQFAPFVRDKNIVLHKKLGKVYLIVAVICIVTLYYLISLGKDAGLPFWPSQYAATTLWLLFIFLAVYFARQRKIQWHRRLMISGFICAAYFVTIRVVDRFCMTVFKSIFTDEAIAYLISDVFVWAVPLTVCWGYWLLFSRVELQKARN